MSRFGDLVGGKQSAPAPAAPSAPAPVAVPTPPAEAAAPDLGEDTTKYEEVIEEELAESYESDVSLQDMSKKELEEYGRTVGIELDRRHSHSRLVKELKAYLEDNS